MQASNMPDPTGKAVLITVGEFGGQEGVCLGRSSEGEDLWAVSPHGSNRILALRFDDEFGVLIKPSQQPDRN